jgi:predicted ABC-type ATPase
MVESGASIWVVAGTNGGGKSSIGGAMIRQSGASYFNPDEAARQILMVNPGATQDEANGAAWREGKRLLERAIDERCEFALETTLGGATITGLLEKAMSSGIEVRIWYVALSSPELQIARVRSRVARGGHDIPEGDIRRRYDSSRENLVRLLPNLTELRVFDNSDEGDPAGGRSPKPKLILHWERGRILDPDDLGSTPPWAIPIVTRAMKLVTG